jgi:hypothetical protein
MVQSCCSGQRCCCSAGDARVPDHAFELLVVTRRPLPPFDMFEHFVGRISPTQRFTGPLPNR